MSVFDFNGGLGEAAAWLCLREDIYISLTKQRPLKTDLETFLQSNVFRKGDDAAYANRMVFLLAKALGCAFSANEQCSTQSLESIRAEVDAWFDSKPAAFNPIHEERRSRPDGRLLPEIWVLSPFHGLLDPKTTRPAADFFKRSDCSTITLRKLSSPCQHLS